jgi:hypothetical protein
MRYRLFLDEVGNDDLEHADDDHHRFLSLTGVVMGERYAATTATQRLDAIKGRFFQGLASHQVIFHRKDIMQRRGPFGILSNIFIADDFDDAVIGYIQDLDFRVITVLIDKFAMRRMTHWKKTHPYHFLMEILVEKYSRFLDDQMSTGDIMPEARRGKKDRELQAAFDEVRKNGTDFATRALITARIPAPDLKFKSKRDNISGLQLCDLIAHPSHQFVRRYHGWHKVKLSPFAERVMGFVEPYKYHRRFEDGRIVGYGIKYLP